MKRKRISLDEEYQQRLESLEHQSRKALNKQAKLLKNLFKGQIARQVKQQQQPEERLQQIKDLDLDPIVASALKQVGFTVTVGTSLEDPTGLKILKHKRMKEVIQGVSRKRKDVLHWYKKKTQKSKQEKQPDSLFLSLNGAAMELEQDQEPIQKKKKNRQGQRARRAKAMAKEKHLYQQQNHQEGAGGSITSLNWRERKKAQPQEQTTPQEEHQQQVEEAVQHHPSWAAKHQQKVGIVEFKGSKITFD